MDNATTASALPAPAAALRRPSPGLLLGPFYPLNQPAAADGFLWRGSSVPAGARHLRLDACVVDRCGEPVAGAVVELWHADPAGRYRHPSAPHSELVLDGFVGYGRVTTAADGVVAFTSLVPGSYAQGDVQRAPHLHLQITGRFDRLVTQVFLPGHPCNATDCWYGALARPELLHAHVLRDAADALHLRWTAALARG
jgi:protocatechuate 3,4-dioxygenase beta subunit